MSNKILNYTEIVSAKYSTAGWKVITPPKSTLNDLIAQHPNGKLHFIQVSINGDVRASGIPNGSFVQNAFSNGAIPVRASIIMNSAKFKRHDPKITLTDANTNSKIIIRHPALKNTNKIENNTE